MVSVSFSVLVAVAAIAVVLVIVVVMTIAVVWLVCATLGTLIFLLINCTVACDIGIEPDAGVLMSI